MASQQIYLSPDELEKLADEREKEAGRLQGAGARQSVLRDAAQLRSYAAMKRYLAAPSLRPPR